MAIPAAPAAVGFGGAGAAAPAIAAEGAIPLSLGGAAPEAGAIPSSGFSLMGPSGSTLTGPETAMAQPWYNSFFSDVGQSMKPKSTGDWMRLGQTGTSMMGGGGGRPAMPAPPPQRLGGSAIPISNPQSLQRFSMAPGGRGGLDPQTMAILQKLLLGRR